MTFTRRTLLMGSAAAAVLAPFRLRAQDVAPADLPTPPQRLAAKGLSGSIEIIDDRWGVPHIRAGSARDAFFGQGWVVARDRLFQLDYEYRRQQGRLSEVLGPDYVRSDTLALLGRYRGDVGAEIAAVPVDVRACVEGHVAGINARIAAVAADPALLPPEFAILGYSPLEWSLADLVAARELTPGNIDDEVRRARLSAADALWLESLIAPPRPARPITFRDGLKVTEVGEPDLGIFGNAPPPAAEPEAAGSNAWTIAPSRSATGRPILANDPHLSIGGFPPRHVAHLSAPGLDVIGAGAPGLAGIMQGHTDRFAFGRTNSHIDQSDLYLLDLNPVDAERYWHRGRWKTFERREVTVSPKGAAPRTVVLRWSVQGPVIAHDPARRRATALAHVSQRPGASGVFAMAAINLARDWKGLQAAFRLHPSPTNFHYADVDGHIAWRILGFAPRRMGGHDGMTPAPGDGRYDWEGLLPVEQLPGLVDPKVGWLASANQDNLPKDYKPILAYSFREPWRYERVVEVLEGQPRHSLTDSVALMQDVASTPARRFVSLIPDTVPDAAAPAAALLRNWDGVLAADSAAAAVYELAWADLEQRIHNIVVPARLRAWVPLFEAGAILSLLESPDKRLGPNPRGSRDLIVAMALAAGWEEAERRLGPEPALWKWGTLHDTVIRHPLARRSPMIAAAFPPIEVGGSGGDGTTVNARWLRGDLGVAGGASYLQAIDVGGWDDSLFLNLPGQSADPKSPHYADMAQPWIEGRMLPLVFTRERVEAEAAGRVFLDPA